MSNIWLERAKDYPGQYVPPGCAVAGLVQMLRDGAIINRYQVTLRYCPRYDTRRAPKPAHVLVRDRHTFLPGLESVFGRVPDVAVPRAKVLELVFMFMHRKDFFVFVQVVAGDKASPRDCHLPVWNLARLGRQVDVDVWRAALLKFEKPEIRDALHASPEPGEPPVKIRLDLPAVCRELCRIRQAEH